MTKLSEKDKALRLIRGAYTRSTITMGQIDAAQPDETKWTEGQQNRAGVESSRATDITELLAKRYSLTASEVADEMTRGMEMGDAYLARKRSSLRGRRLRD